MFSLLTLTNKTPVCKQNLCKHSLDETTLTHFITMNNALFRSNFKVLLCLFSLQKILKFSVYNSQVILLYLSSSISNKLLDIHACLK